jgi:sugar phosphate isomerase/epimerase
MPTHHLLNGFSLWGLEGLYDPPISGVADVKADGYAAMEVSYFHIRAETVGAVKKNGLALIVQRACESVEDLVGALVSAKRHGALLVNVHAGNPHLSHEECVALVNGMIDAAEEHGMRLLFETHRGRITQDLYRTLRLVEAVPRMRLTMDVSHYILCEEQPGPTEQLMPYLRPLFDRVEMMHGRVCSGEQIQVDIGDGSGELAQLYKSFWTEVMRAWRKRSAPGSVFVFTPELGPPAYAITDSAGKEISTRWEQSKVIRQLGEEAWKASAVAVA